MKMKTKITIEVEGDQLWIVEENCVMENYIISENQPQMIDDICEHLHDYLEGM